MAAAARGVGIQERYQRRDWGGRRGAGSLSRVGIAASLSGFNRPGARVFRVDRSPLERE